MRCIQCQGLTDEDDAVFVGLNQPICGVCIEIGINPRWTGPRDYNRSEKQTANVKRHRGQGERQMEVPLPEEWHK